MNNISLHLTGAGELASAASTPAAPQRLAENRELIQAVKAVNATEMPGDGNDLNFSIDPGTHQPVVKIVNRQTKEVIRQIPAEVVLRLAADLKKESE